LVLVGRHALIPIDARFLIGCMKNRDECRNGMER